MGEPRLSRRDEVNALSDLLCTVFGFDQYYDRAAFTKGLLRPVHLRGGVVIAEDGKPVSHIFHASDTVSLCGCSFRVASLGGVGTHPDYRNRGHAGRILEESLARMTANRARIVIVSGDRSLYRRNHCVPAGDVLETRIFRDSLPPVQSGLAVRRFEVGDWPSLSPLNQAEPVRFARSADFFSKCCSWWDISQPEVWVIADRERPLAYLSLHRPWRDESKRTRTVGDYAGCRAAILDALPLIVETDNVQEIDLRFLRHDREFAYLLSRRGLQLKSALLWGTHRILNLPGLMRDLRPYLSARLTGRDLRQLSFGQQADVCTFSHGPQRVELDLSQTARLVLGSPEAPHIDGELGRVLGTVFPIPFPMPGFNYV
ncbi:MAG: GNAT family N-acetyltransferase [Armatimonadota bacterium]|jgi:predicted N-acetyltransferase YhbS